MAAFFIFAIGTLAAVVVVMYFVDRNQTKQTIRRNYPVIGRFRYLFEHIGEFLRQYFFAMDREELPFNRAQRAWVYRAAKNIDSTVAFGSSKDLSRPGNIIFVNTAYPTLDEDAVDTSPLVIGPDCALPFQARRIVNISGMSYGALSQPAVRALSHGAAMAGCWMNTGEGGLSPYHLEGGADIVFQIGTAKYGVRDDQGRLSDEKLKQVAAKEPVRMFEIKLSQGAKPGKGGILPAAKVSAEIAEIRGIPEGQASISPNRHPEIRNADDLLDMIDRVRKITGKPTGIKAVLGAPAWLDELFSAINQRGELAAPDFITLDSADGGTGAAPMSLIDDVGLPLRESLPILINKLHDYGLRDRIRVVASGKLLTPSAVATAICIGADFVTVARGFMFSLGCIQALQCNKNTCPTGVTTHNPRLQRGLDPKDKATRVYHYHHNLEKEVGIIAHSCGVAEPRQLRRHHARRIMENGHSVGLDELYQVEPK
ncbi:MAG: FMN-binding glutamate synthase family protein [Pseudomonadota bacterium]|nr:FMN-binding glutamate synthase family protein [Pseudomonadales bacterium]MDY6919297.1 FMN-binding glutamate synthase family protein [Pseudomonadota bacterium]